MLRLTRNDKARNDKARNDKARNDKASGTVLKFCNVFFYYLVNRSWLRLNYSPSGLM